MTDITSGILPDILTSYLSQGVAACVYSASKGMVDKSIHLAAGACDTAAQMSEYVLNSAAEYTTGANPQYCPYSSTVKPFLAQHNPLARVNAAATKLIAPEAYRLAKEGATPELAPFQASDLIGPVILLTLSSKKSSENALRACSKIKLLATGKREIIGRHDLPTGCNFGSCTTSIYSHETFTTGKLLMGTVLDLTWCAGWLALSQTVSQGIHHAISATDSAAAATTVIKAIQVGSFAVPLLWSAFSYLTKTEQAPIQEPAEKTPPEAAQQQEEQGTANAATSTCACTCTQANSPKQSLTEQELLSRSASDAATDFEQPAELSAAQL